MAAGAISTRSRSSRNSRSISSLRTGTRRRIRSRASCKPSPRRRGPSGVRRKTLDSRRSLSRAKSRGGNDGLRLARPIQTLRKRLQQLGRQREHDRRRLVAGDRRQRLQVAKLHRLRCPREHQRRLQQLLGGLQLALGMDYLGATFALGLGLARDRTYHRLVDVDVLYFDGGDLDAPRVGLRVEDLLDVGVQLLTLGQHVVELVLAQYRAQRRLRELRSRLEEIRDLDDRLLRIDHAKVKHRVHLHRHVVARDHVLAWDVVHDGAQVDAHDLLDDRPDQHEPGTLDRREAPEEEHDAALILAENADARCDEHHQNQERAAPTDRPDHHPPPLSSGRRISNSPSTAAMRACAPRFSGTLVRARQRSPNARTHPSRSMSSSASTLPPTIASAPATGGRRRERSANVPIAASTTAFTSTIGTTKPHEIVKPGISASIRNSTPATNATMPPTPITPNVGKKASATIIPRPSSSSATAT